MENTLLINRQVKAKKTGKTIEKEIIERLILESKALDSGWIDKIENSKDFSKTLEDLSAKSIEDLKNPIFQSELDIVRDRMLLSPAQDRSNISNRLKNLEIEGLLPEEESRIAVIIDKISKALEIFSDNMVF